MEIEYFVMQNMGTDCIITQEFGRAFDYILQNAKVLFTSWPFIAFLIFLFLNEAINSILGKTKFGFRNGRLFVEQRENSEIAPPSELNGLDSVNKNKKSKKILPPPIPDNGYKKYLETVVTDVRKQLKDSPFHETEVLIRDDAIFRMLVDFERLYFSIFGSQIAFLDFLTQQQNGITPYKMRQFFNREKQNRKWDIDIDYDKWVSYMISTQLIVKDKGNVVSITDKGSAFFTYLIERNYDLKEGENKL